MSLITEQDIWDLLDGNCTEMRAKHIQEQLQLKEHREMLQFYQTMQVVNSDLHAMQVTQPAANFNVEVMAKLQVAPKPNAALSTDSQPFWQPTSKWFLAAFLTLAVLIYLLKDVAVGSDSETMGWVGIFILEGFERLAYIARHPLFFMGLGIVYVLGLLTLLDGFLKRLFRYKRMANHR
ncbi:MAG: hypothetical protein R3E32_10610 [Chitinophagales bacterium]